ncbi:hypothetical protein GCM10009555_037680 [Acrocarpospora macrocephala]|uniref:hypothetical protein n=1 Tax=Acrocarpospora macrocephala TaxID=150177 RepID=UPI0012D3454E|nr:hypothetical protein [Acrocarpospora macrocephala]
MKKTALHVTSGRNLLGEGAVKKIITPLGTAQNLPKSAANKTINHLASGRVLLREVP